MAISLMPWREILNVHKTKKFQHFKEENVWVKTSQYVNIDGEKYEPGTYHLKCIHNAIQLVY